MPYSIVIPRLGLTMEEGELVEWFVPDGHAVQKGEPLFAVETDKATQEVEAPVSGIVYHRPGVPRGMLPIGTVIGAIAQEGETVTWPDDTDEAAPAPASEPSPVPQVSTAAASNGHGEKRASPAARRRAAELGLDWRTLAGSSREGHVLLKDVEQAPAQRSVTPAAALDITPVARRAAEDLGVDLEALAARFPGKRLTREDVEAAARLAASPQPEPSASETRSPMTRTRQVIAERMSRSAHTTAPVTLTAEIDASELVALRQQLKADGQQPIPSYNDLLAKLCAVALAEHPALNARLDGDEVVQSSSVHIGIAVDTPRGLLVPVVRDVQAKSIRQIAAESAQLIEATRDGTARPDDLQGSTFTITNLGMYGIDAFTPIINLPECAILGVGRIVPKLVVLDADNGQTAIRHMMFLSLTFDHRLVDGGPAARFLQRVRQFVERPYLWLVG